MKMWAYVRTGLVGLLRGVVILLVALMTLDVLWGVFSRFVLGNQAPYTDEAARVLLVWISFLGGALAFEAKAHLGVDFLMLKLNPAARKLGALAVHVLMLLLASAVFIYGGWQMASAQMDSALVTMPLLSRGMVYLSVPISGAFIVLFTLESFIAIVRTPAEALGALTQSEG